MKTDLLKKLIKEAVQEAIRDELKDILLEAVKANKQPIRESVSDNRTISFTSKNVEGYNPATARQSYMEILGDMAKGPESGFTGEFKMNGPVGPMSTMAEGSSLPQGQLGLDQIMNLIKK